MDRSRVSSSGAVSPISSLPPRWASKMSSSVRAMPAAGAVDALTYGSLSGLVAEGWCRVRGAADRGRNVEPAARMVGSGVGGGEDDVEPGPGPGAVAEVAAVGGGRVRGLLLEPLDQ